MQVETFEVTEIDVEGQPECEAEALELIETLDLEGQRKLVANDSGTKTRAPYRKMSADEEFVYQILCPIETRLTEYSDSPIPVRVLQVAAHAKELFDDLFVWSAENADVKDPVLVGTRGEWSNKQTFILARWGEELAPPSELMVKACRLHRDKLTAAFQDILSKVTAKLSVLQDDNASVRHMGKPTFYE